MGAALRRGDAKLARRLLGELKDAFGDRLYLELVRHGLAEEDAVEPAMLDLAYALDCRWSRPTTCTSWRPPATTRTTR